MNSTNVFNDICQRFKFFDAEELLKALQLYKCFQNIHGKAIAGLEIPHFH